MPVFHHAPRTYSKIHKGAVQSQSRRQQPPPNTESLTNRRNEKLLKNVERQIDYDERLLKKEEAKRRRSSNKENDNRRDKPEDNMNPRDKYRDRNAQGASNSRKDPPAKPSEVDKNKKQEETVPEINPATAEPKLLKISRLDAIVLIIIIAQVLACIAVGLEGHAFQVDFTYWNNLLEGNKLISEVEPKSIMRGKTIELESHFYLVKAKEYLKRKESKEIIFMLLIMGILLGTAIHLFGYYLKTDDFEDRAAILISWYAGCGAICIFSGVFLISSAVRIENSYTYAADMLFNFQHYLDNDDAIHNQSLCPTDAYVRGCDSYEYARKQAKDLEMIFRLCGSGSRFTRYYEESKTDNEKIYIVGEEFSRKKLKAMGFCSPDGYKYMAAILAMIAGILFAIVPAVFCCEANSIKKQPYNAVLMEEEELRRKEGLFDDSGIPVRKEDKIAKKKRKSQDNAGQVERAEMRRAMKENEERRARRSSERKRSLGDDSKKSNGSKQRGSVEQEQPAKGKITPDELIFGWKKYIESDSG